MSLLILVVDDEPDVGRFVTRSICASNALLDRSAPDHTFHVCTVAPDAARQTASCLCPTESWTRVEVEPATGFSAAVCVARVLIF
jgi:hypothetical protein